MSRCAHCEGKFGMVRHYAYYIMGLFIHKLMFCSEDCANRYEAEKRRKRQSQQFNGWLHS